MNKINVLTTYCYPRPPPCLAGWLALADANPDIRFVVADDHSPSPFPAATPANMIVARIDQDMGFNNGGASNVAICLAEPGCWALRVDFDHPPTQAMLDAARDFPVVHNMFYYIPRDVDIETESQYAPNIYLAERDMLIKAGGYDMDFSGRYGCEDKFLQYCWRHTGGDAVKLPPDQFPPVPVVKLEGVPVDKNPAINRKLMEDKLAAGQWPQWANAMPFGWHVVKGARP